MPVVARQDVLAVALDLAQDALVEALLHGVVAVHRVLRNQRELFLFVARPAVFLFVFRLANDVADGLLQFGLGVVVVSDGFQDLRALLDADLRLLQLFLQIPYLHEGLGTSESLCRFEC